jgi:hypothetical protein
VIGRLYPSDDCISVITSTRCEFAIFRQVAVAVLLAIHREWTGDIINIAKDSTGGIEQIPIVAAAASVAHRLPGNGMANRRTLGPGRGRGFTIGGAWA